MCPSCTEDSRVTRRPWLPGTCRLSVTCPARLGLLLQAQDAHWEHWLGGRDCWSADQHSTNACFHGAPAEPRLTVVGGFPTPPGCSLHPNSADCELWQGLWHQEILACDSSSHYNTGSSHLSSVDHVLSGALLSAALE